MNCKQTRENLVLHRQGSKLQGAERRVFLQHLRGCKACQVEYEGLLQTASMLGSLEVPVPSRELLGNIQNQIREFHKQRRTAFFASPISWLFGKFKLGFSPKIVNCVALLCYLIATTFLVKLVFFTDTPKQIDVPEQNLGLTALEVSRLPYVRIVPSQLASLKHGIVNAKKASTTKIESENNVVLSHPFVDFESAEAWHTHVINEATEAVDVHLAENANKKLTLFWNEIKTNL